MKKKILIMGFTKIKYMPYMNFYLENINKSKNDIHLLYWNRDLQDENLSEYEAFTLHEFMCYQEDDVSKISKLSSFIKYRNFTRRIIQKYKFDFIFVLHSLPGVLLSNILTRQYRNKFILDYRDSTYEGFGLFKKIVGALVKKSKATFVSSDAFRGFLPESEKDKIFTSHNLLMDSLNHRNERELYGVQSNKIRIAFWGFVRHEEINKEIIKKISKDNRFELHYYGREQQVALNLKKYVSEIEAKNIFFHGEYIPIERYKFVRSTDIIHNIYYDNNTMLAMGNKYYDGIIFRLPQICMEGSFMGRKVTENRIGFECNPYDRNFTEKIYQYFINVNIDEFDKNCDEELDRVYEEYNNGLSLLSESYNCEVK